MTKEEWLVIRVKEEIPTGVFYEYFKEMGGRATLQEFMVAFPKMCTIDQRTQKDEDTYRELSFGTAIRRLYKYWDEKFDVI